MIEMIVRSDKGGDGHGHGHSHCAPKPVAAAAPATEGRVTRSSAKKAVAKEEKTSDAKDDGAVLEIGLVCMPCFALLRTKNRTILNPPTLTLI
jgi:hypothetical protein